MANQKLYIIEQNTGQLIPIKLIDPGDGTGYSIATSGSGGGGSGDASAANQVLTNTKLDTLITQTNDLGTTVSSTLQNAVAANANGSNASAGGYATALFQVSGLGVATINFEITNDNGTTWSTLSVYSPGGVITSTVTTNGLYRAQLAGLDTTNGLIRARISGYSSGTITVTVTLSTVVAANKYVGSSQLPTALGQTTKAASLAVTPASDYNQPILPVNSAILSGSVTSNNADLVAAFDATNYRSLALQLGGFGSATVQVQVSLDAGVTYNAIRGVSNGSVISISPAASGLYHYTLPPSSLLRIRTTAYSSGTITAFAVFSTIATPLPDSAVTLLSASGGAAPFNNSSVDGNTFGTGYAVASSPYYYNETNGDRQRGTVARTLLTSAARTVTTNSSDQINYNWRGLILTVDISSIGTGSITPSLQYKDSISSNYKTIWTASAALIANGTYTYAIYPGELNTASMTEVVNALLTRTFRLAMVANNANSVTYSASADMQL